MESRRCAIPASESRRHLYMSMSGGMPKQKRDSDPMLPAGADIDGLTGYLFAVMQGMAIQAGSGASRDDLERVLETSLKMWPCGDSNAAAQP